MWHIQHGYVTQKLSGTTMCTILQDGIQDERKKKTFNPSEKEEITENWYLLDNEHLEDQFIMECNELTDDSECKTSSSSESESSTDFESGWKNKVATLFQKIWPKNQKMDDFWPLLRFFWPSVTNNVDTWKTKKSSITSDDKTSIRWSFASKSWVVDF